MEKNPENLDYMNKIVGFTIYKMGFFYDVIAAVQISFSFIPH